MHLNGDRVNLPYSKIKEIYESRRFQVVLHGYFRQMFSNLLRGILLPVCASLLCFHVCQTWFDLQDGNNILDHGVVFILQVRRFSSNSLTTVPIGGVFFICRSLKFFLLSRPFHSFFRCIVIVTLRSQWNSVLEPFGDFIIIFRLLLIDCWDDTYRQKVMRHWLFTQHSVISRTCETVEVTQAVKAGKLGLIFGNRPYLGGEEGTE